MAARSIAPSTVTITGTNDAPVVAATDVTGAVTELVTPAGNLTDSGTIAFTDVDLTDAHSIDPTVTASAGALGTLTASVSTRHHRHRPGRRDRPGTTASRHRRLSIWPRARPRSRASPLRWTMAMAARSSHRRRDDHRHQRCAGRGGDGRDGAVTELVTPAGNLTDSGTIAFTDVDLTDMHSIDPTITASAGRAWHADGEREHRHRPRPGWGGDLELQRRGIGR